MGLGIGLAVVGCVAENELADWDLPDGDFQKRLVNGIFTVRSETDQQTYHTDLFYGVNARGPFLIGG